MQVGCEHDLVTPQLGSSKGWADLVVLVAQVWSWMISIFLVADHLARVGPFGLGFYLHAYSPPSTQPKRSWNSCCCKSEEVA